jgi:hypothetical protein
MGTQAKPTEKCTVREGHSLRLALEKTGDPLKNNESKINEGRNE